VKSACGEGDGVAAVLWRGGRGDTLGGDGADLGDGELGVSTPARNGAILTPNGAIFGMLKP